jgi:hypothetical protein
MYFWNGLPAIANVSQSISYFASLLRNLRLSFYWGAKAFAQLIKSSREDVNRRGWDASWVALAPGRCGTHPLRKANVFWDFPAQTCLYHLTCIPFDPCETSNCILAASCPHALLISSHTAVLQEKGKKHEELEHLMPTIQGFMVSYVTRVYLDLWNDIFFLL